MDWAPIIAAGIQVLGQGALGGVQGKATENLLEKKGDIELEIQKARDQAEMERLLEGLGVRREEIEANKQQAALAATAGLTRQALANVPDAYKTMIEAILGGRGQEQAAFANLATNSQRAAMGR